MVVNFYTPKKRLNKDCMGSFGLGFELGKGLAGLIGLAKRFGVNIPDMQTVLMATEYKRLGHQITFAENGELNLIHTSITGYKEEQKVDGLAYGAMATACPELFNYPETGCVLKDPFICPDWSLFDYKSFKYFPSLKRRPIVTMQASWGCEYNCSYCPYRSYYGDRKAKPIENIRKELRYLAGLGVRGIVFRDPLFTADRDETLKVIEELQAWTKGRHNCFEPLFYWVCETRLERVDEDLLDRMKQAGCEAIHFGIESANDRVLKSVNRSNPPKERQKELIDYCEKIGIKTSCFFVLCFPEDDRFTCFETILHAINLNPNTAEFFIAQPYPGTRMAKQVKRTEDYDKMNGYTLCYDHKSITKDEASKLRDTAYRLFYLRWGWIKKFIRGM